MQKKTREELLNNTGFIVAGKEMGDHIATIAVMSGCGIGSQELGRAMFLKFGTLKSEEQVLRAAVFFRNDGFVLDGEDRCYTMSVSVYDAVMEHYQGRVIEEKFSIGLVLLRYPTPGENLTIHFKPCVLSSH
jgi:hypothetical protein